ncbi:pyruvate kinase [Micromonospora sp. NBC_01796]|uniref:pyruvate kinase n=1 Tax=Micromonospora sp. NBC_01796 TaxID=2975987 RepID=UPI002DD79ED6|nr:pyruvate kinase [Micromonospora sp. NBC_01796]WSA84624.1 pyruvate kinase [Micromonospora sp. NBC_01796]
MARRAKIVCTLGPACAAPDRLRDLVEAGMDVARIDLDHGTPAGHAAAYRLLRETAARAGRTVGVLADLRGPRLTFGRPATGSAFTEQLTADLRFVLGLGVDLVALSAVGSPEDVKVVRDLMDGYGVRRPVLAKLDTPSAVRHLDDLVAAFDGLVVARDDLGVELPLDEIPLIQKRAIRRCRELAKPVIVAGQLLDSMVEQPRPTRAEASDVANAVLDGADALLLGAETGIGAFPVPAVRMMAQILGTAEASAPARRPPLRVGAATNVDAIAEASVEVAESLGVKAICCFTRSGATARQLARHRPAVPLLAFTPDPDLPARLALTWGVETFGVPVVVHTDEMVHHVQDVLLSLPRFEVGDLVLIVAGSPPGLPGSTNTMRLLRLGDRVLARPPLPASVPLRRPAPRPEPVP